MNDIAFRPSGQARTAPPSLPPVIMKRTVLEAECALSQTNSRDAVLIVAYHYSEEISLDEARRFCQEQARRVIAHGRREIFPDGTLPGIQARIRLLCGVAILASCACQTEREEPTQSGRCD